MSHEATGWASKQRGIKPAAKVVLWQLCDRYHPDNGCFPSQDTLAEDCEMSRSSLNDQLCALELAGLIRREQRRDGKTRKQKSTRYRFAFEPDFEAESSEKPCPKSGHGSVSEKGQKPCPNFGESRVRNSDTNLVREPVREPEREGARARGSVSGPEEGKPESGDTSSQFEQSEAHEPAPASTDDPAKFDSRVKRIGADWPGWAGNSTRYAIAEFAKLSDAERAEAEAARDRYLAECKRQRARPVAVGVYFRDRKWVDLPERAETAPRFADAPVFGPLWGAVRMEHLLAGPAAFRFAPTNFERAMIAESKLDEADLRRERQARDGFPAVNLMHRQAESRKGATVAAARQGLAGAMEPVPVGSDTWEAWRAEHERRGWPWLPDPGRQPVVYFPAAGPAGLDAFKVALAKLNGKRGQDDDGGTGDAERRTNRYAESRSQA